jgi:hypothetical protein
MRDLCLLSPPAIDKTTRAAAAAVRLVGRGVLREGWADGVRPDRISDSSTSNHHRYGVGIRRSWPTEVVMNGRDYTGALGRVSRRADRLLWRNRRERYRPARILIGGRDLHTVVGACRTRRDLKHHADRSGRHRDRRRRGEAGGVSAEGP